MQPLKSTLESIEIEPLSEVRKNLNVEWYRCPIERARLVELSKRDNGKAAFQAIGHLGLFCATTFVCWYLFVQQAWVLFAISLFIHGSFSSFLPAPHHELCHGSVFRTRWMNEVFLHVFSLLGWQQFPIYRFSHSYHHRFTLHPKGDREEVMPETPSLRFLYIVQLFTVNIFGGYQSRGILPVIKATIRIARDDFTRPFNYWGEELYAEHPKERRMARNWARTLLAFHSGVLMISIASGHWIIAVLISGAAFIGNWYRYFVGITQHCGLRSNIADFRKCTRSVKLDPFTEFLYWHMNWHLEHHMYAAVPCYNLKALHNELADDMPALRTLSGAWKEMRDTWRRQKVDPTYAYDTPIPNTKYDNSSIDKELVQSMGGLTPESIAGDMSQNINYP